MTYNKVQDVLRKYCGLFANYDIGNQGIFAPINGTHLIISGSVTLTDYNCCLCNESVYNLCEGDEIPELRVNEIRTVIYECFSDIVYYLTYIPCIETDTEVLKNFITAAPNSREIDDIIKRNGIDTWTTHEGFEQCYRVRNNIPEYGENEYLFFESPNYDFDPSYFTGDNYKLAYDNNIANMSGYIIFK